MIFDDSQPTSLDLSGTGISSLRGFDELQKMRRPIKLCLDRNPLRSLEHISSSNTLQSLSLDSTELANFSGVKPQPALRELSVRNTPVACTPYYRVACLLAFGPKLRVIDGVAVTAAEIDAAFGFGADAAVAVSFGWIPPNTVARSSEDYAKLVRALHAEKRAAAPQQKRATPDVTLAQIAEKMNLYNRSIHNSASGNSVAASPQRGSSSSEVASLQAKIVELEQKVMQLQREKEQQSAALLSAADIKQQQQRDTSSAVPAADAAATAAGNGTKFHSMKVPGVTVSELDTIDTLTWAAPATTVYAFVTGSAAAVAMTTAPELTASSIVVGAGEDRGISSSLLPQSVALSLTRHTLEIQRLMSRQAMFRHPLSLLARVEAGETNNSASSSSSSSSWARGPNAAKTASSGPFNTVASLHLHFSDGCSALLLFASQPAMNAVFKALKYRCVGASRTIAFSLDANLDSLPDFIAPNRLQEEFVDLFSKSVEFRTHSAMLMAMNPVSSSMISRGGSMSASLAGFSASSPLVANSNSNNNTVRSAGGVPLIKNLAAASSSHQQQQTRSPGLSTTASADRPIVGIRPQTPSSVSGRGGSSTAFQPGGKRAINVVGTAAGANNSNNKDPEGDFQLDSDTDSEEEKKRKVAEEEKAKQQRSSGGLSVVIPTGIKVGRSTPQPATATVATPTTATPASATTPALASGSSVPSRSPVLAAPAGAAAAPVVSPTVPVVVGQFKGRALVVGGGDSDSDDDD